MAEKSCFRPKKLISSDFFGPTSEKITVFRALEKGEQEAMNNMLPMILMMMDENEVDEDGNVVSFETISTT